MRKINVVELFAGVGGFKVGLEKTFGSKKTNVVLASELNKKTADTYEKMHGFKPKGDITQIHVNEIPEHDLLVGGFPCQSFSYAGKQQGFCDTRGTLFFEIVRIAKEKQPKIIFLENVKGLLSHDKGKTITVMLQVLTDIGYHVDFHVLNSEYFSVPQTRERVYIVAVRNDLIQKNNESINKWFLEKDKKIVTKTKSNLNENHDLKINKFNFEFPLEQKNQQVNLIDFLENSEYIDNNTPIEFKEIWLNDYPELREIKKGVVYPFHSVQRKKVRHNGKRYRHKNPTNMFTLTVVDHHGIVYKNIHNKTDFRMLTAREMLRLQGFNDDLIDRALSSNATERQLRMMAGNAVTVNVISEIATQFKKYLL